MQLSLESWTARFDSPKKAEKAGALKCLSISLDGIRSSWEEVKIPTLESLQKASISFKTPRKLRVRAVLGPDTIPVTSRPHSSTFSKVTPLDIDNGEDVNRAKIQRALQTVMLEWNQLNSTFQLICMEFDKSGLGETRNCNIILETLGENSGDNSG